jgi:hypothetical protein
MEDRSESSLTDASPYESAPSPDEQKNTAQSFDLGGISVGPASSDTSAAYEYEDLQRGSATSTLLIHTLYWPIYVLFVFPIQYIVRILIWGFWKKRHVWNVRIRIRMFLGEAIENLRKLRFLVHSRRRTIYLRASRIYTPAQLLPFVSGTKPISEDSSSERPPTPDNWDSIRKHVYERDGYACVNCCAKGGTNGDAELHADHVLPKSRDGPNTLQNLRTLCRECHEARHARNFD